MGFNNTHKAIKLRAMEQLFQGHELATQLQELISQPGSGQGSAEDLVKKILGSFDNTISVLDSIESISSTSSLAGFEGSQNASCDNDGKFEDSGDSKKRLGPVKGKRGCYKRKKRAETWTVESTIPEDNFSWRKYGQKEILNAKFPRSYFRCTHKYTQGCKATKQVQKVELEPRLFSITYIGNHTCDTNNEDTPYIKKTCDHHDEIIMDSQGLKTPSFTMKEEEDNHHHHGSSTEKDLSLVWPDMIFEDDHHHHHHHETSASINVLCSTDLMVFEAGNDFGFSEDEQLSIFD